MAEIEEVLAAIAEHGQRSGTLPPPAFIRRRGDRRRHRVATAWAVGVALVVAGFGAIAAQSNSRDHSALPIPSASDRPSRSPATSPSGPPASASATGSPSGSPAEPSARTSAARPTGASPTASHGPDALPDDRRYRLLVTGSGAPGIASGGGDMALALDLDGDRLYLAPPGTADPLALWVPLPRGDRYLIMLGVPKDGARICIAVPDGGAHATAMARARTCAPDSTSQLFTFTRVGTTRDGQPTYSVHTESSYLGISDGVLVAVSGPKRAAVFVFDAQ